MTNGQDIEVTISATPEVPAIHEPIAIPATAVESITRAEIDTQIATARRYRRSLTLFAQTALRMATLDPETAASCFYMLPRGGKKIEGPSVRLAEICASAWGNLRYGARTVADSGTSLTAQGFAHDLETNVAMTIEVQRGVVDRNNRRYSEDMVNVTANAACSIARRNAIFGVIPRAYVDTIYKQAKKVAVGDEKTLTTRRDQALAHFASLDVPKERVLARLGKPGVADIDLADLELLTGLKTAIKDGDTTVDEAFPLPATEKPAEGATKAEALAAEIKKK